MTPHPCTMTYTQATHSAMPSSPPSRGKRRRGGSLPLWLPSSPLLLFVILLLLLPLQPCARLAKPPTRSVDPYNERIVQALVDYSAAAYYCRTSACELWMCSACFRHPHTQVTRMYDSAHNGNGFVGWDPDEGVIVVAFAGTDTKSMKNWIDDIDGILTPWPEDGCAHCKVHAGFLATYAALQPQLVPLVEALVEQHPQAPIWVTGHSLGAALAVLCTMDLLSHSYNVRQTISFGQPRVGNKELSAFFANQTLVNSVPFYRLVHHRDPVPHLPPQSFGFHHPPFEVFYTEDESSYVICDPTGEDKHCSNQYYVDTSINDHLNYLGVLFGAEELEGRLQEITLLRGVEVNEGGGVAGLSPV